MNEEVQPPVLSFEDRVYKLVEEKLGIHKDHPKRYLVTAYLSALNIVIANDRSGALAKLDAKSKLGPLLKVIREELLVDNITCYLMATKGVLTVKESTMELVARLSDKHGILIQANPFTTEAVRYLEEKDAPFPLSMSYLPARIAAESITKENCSAIFVHAVAKERFEIIKGHVYNVQDLLAMARKRIVDGVVIDLNSVYGPLDIRKHATHPSSPWSGKNPTDFIEMLRKTAIKNFIKYFSLKTINGGKNE